MRRARMTSYQWYVVPISITIAYWTQSHLYVKSQLYHTAFT